MSIRGSSVVPGFPKMCVVPAARRISKNACRPDLVLTTVSPLAHVRSYVTPGVIGTTRLGRRHGRLLAAKPARTLPHLAAPARSPQALGPTVTPHARGGQMRRVRLAGRRVGTRWPAVAHAPVAAALVAP